MRSAKNLYVLAITAGLLMLSSCGGLNSSERKAIGKSGEGIMRLLLVGNADDSLFLRQNAKELTRKDISSRSFATLKERMLETVNDPSNSGVGIAAPQVGISRRLIAVQRFDKPGEPFELYVNPYITEYSADKGDGREGCLSIPGYAGQVERSREIEITYTDEESFKPVTEKIAGYTAVIFQHEIDHLDGILYTDKAASLHKYK